MNAKPSTVFEAIKDSLSILEVAELLHTEPRRESGKIYGVRFNPIRDEASPSNSFKLYTDTNRFYDFATGKNGDVIDLLAQAKGLSASEARELALSFIGKSKPLFATQNIPQVETARSINLKGYDKALKARIAAQRAATPPNTTAPYIKALYELLHPDFLGFADEVQRKRVYNMLGWSDKHKSLTVTLYDEQGEPQAIAVRYAKDRSGQTIKWKTFGSKAFMPHRLRLNNGFVFMASGIAEVLIFEVLGVDYLVLQSDSIKPDRDKVKAILGESLAVFILDNDQSCKAAYEAFKRIYEECIAIDFEAMLDRKLPKGYDLRDFVNETAEATASLSGGSSAGETALTVLNNEIVKIVQGEGLQR